MTTDTPETTPEIIPPDTIPAIADLGAPSTSRLLGGLSLEDPATLQAELDRYGTLRQIFIDWLMAHLTPGTDWMLIHRRLGRAPNKQDCPNKQDAGSSRCEHCGGKAILAKPGSEKLCGLLRLRPRFRRDGETWEMLGSEPGVIALLCELVDSTGAVVAEGRGARHRDFDQGDLNKSIKMAEKSSQVDAVLRCAGLSELFSQDLEDLSSFDNGSDAGEFQAPRRKSETTAAPAPATLQAQLEESVRRTAPAAPDRRPTPRPTPRPAPRAPTAPAAPPASDGLSDARVRRLMAMLHEELRRNEVPEEQHEGVFEIARTYLVEWVGRETGRERLSDCPWRAYDDLCAQIPAAVGAALGGDGSPARSHPRLVQRRYGAPRSMNVPRREF